MGEFLFVLKCLMVTALITFVLQLEMGGVRLERTLQSSIMGSPAVHWVQSAASGGALMIRNASRTITVKFKEMTTSGRDGSVSASAYR